MSDLFWRQFYSSSVKSTSRHDMSRLVVQSSLLWKTCVVLQLLQGLVASKDESIIDDSSCFKQLLSIIKFNYYTSYKSYKSYQSYQSHLSVLSVSQYLHHPCSPCRSAANWPCLDPNSIDIIGPVPQLGEMYIWNTKWRKYGQEIMGVPTVPTVPISGADWMDLKLELSWPHHSRTIECAGISPPAGSGWVYLEYIRRSWRSRFWKCLNVWSMSEALWMK